MKKGCFGCFGGGCFFVIALVGILSYMGYSFMQTTGREALAKELEAMVRLVIDKGISDEGKKAEAYEITENFANSVKNGEVALLDIFSQLNEVFDEEHLIKTQVISLYKKIDDEDFKATYEEENAVKKLITALYNNELDNEQVASFTEIFKALREGEVDTDAVAEGEDEGEERVGKGEKVKSEGPIFLNYEYLTSKEFTKENFGKALKAITMFTQENALVNIDEDFDTDDYIGLDIKKIIFQLSNPRLAEELAEKSINEQ